MVPHPPIILPEVGRGEEKKIQKTTDAYLRVAEEVAALRPETIVISSPHSVSYADYFHISPGSSAEGDMGGFRAPQVSFREKYDEDFVERLSAIAHVEEFAAGTLGQRAQDVPLDHGTMIPLYFIRKKYSDFKLVRIGLSGMSLEEHYKMGMMIKEASEALDRRVVYIASGDLAHKMKEDGPYGFAPEAPEYDERIMHVMGSGNFAELFDFDEGFLNACAECGHRSFVMMAGAFDGQKVKTQALSHEATFGVGYGICTCYPLGADEGRRLLLLRHNKKEAALSEQKENEDAWVRMARASLESYILKREKIRAEAELPRIIREAKVLDSTHEADAKTVEEALLKQKAGAFVSLHLNGKLRGCIGTIVPTTKNVAEELIQNAISAATADHRFFPVRKDEVPFLEYSVDVLSEPVPIADASVLDVKKYGVIVRQGRKQGLLLPDLEGVDTVEDQIAIAAQKGGIDLAEEIELYRFEVIRHH